MVAGAAYADLMTQIPAVPAEQLSNDAVMVDVREQHEWDMGHAVNAVLIPMGELPARLGDLPEVDDSLVIMCRSGNRSGRVVQWLAAQGYDVVNADGGMLAWQQAGKPMVSETSAGPRVQ